MITCKQAIKQQQAVIKHTMTQMKMMTLMPTTSIRLKELLVKRIAVRGS